MAKQTNRGPGRPPGSKNKTKQEHIKDVQIKNDKDRRKLDIIWSITLIAFGIFLFFTVITDTTGAFGEKIHDVCLGLFGSMAYLLPFLVIIFGVLLIAKILQHISGRTTCFAILMYFMICILNSYRFIDEKKLAFGFEDIVKYFKMGVEGKKGGAVGMELGSLIVKFIGKPGLIILTITIIIISIFLIANTPISEFFTNWNKNREEKKLMKELDAAEQAKENVHIQDKTIPEPVQNYQSDVKPERSIFGGRAVDEKDTFVNKEPVPNKNASNFKKYDSENLGLGATTDKAQKGYGLGNPDEVKPSGSYGLGNEGVVVAGKTGKGLDEKGGKPKRVIKTAQNSSNKKSEKPEDDVVLDFNKGNDDAGYALPSVSLLKKGATSQKMMTNSELDDKADLLERTLKTFGVEATVLTVTQGASVTRYEIQPATGVKVNSIKRLENDIALNLRAKSLRIEAPIPGKAAVGIEVENENPAPVLVRDLIETEEFVNSKSNISFVVGKDISGKNIIADLKSMPHLLIAGATGSGKSVCVNSIIASFLYKAKPSELKLVMIDPKVVELQHYNAIPHMLTPVVTDPRKAARALSISVQEMEKRYDLFAEKGVKDLESYNELMIKNKEPQNCKPQIVIIIDELADLMMASSNEVETSIARLTAKARAAGMHLIVATQRPSVDVITGVIKNNIPSRIAFSVSSQFDSRTILDAAGAEKLLGKGDMLFKPVGVNDAFRVQGPFISDAETNKLIKFVSKQGGSPVYDEEIQNALESTDSGNNNSNEPEDDLTEDAIELILKSKQASVSMLQRRFRIGYNRAARIIDEIEAKGIIGPSDGSRPRQVLVTEEEYYGNDDVLIDTDPIEAIDTNEGTVETEETLDELEKEDDIYV